MDSSILSLLIFLPVVGALVMLIVSLLINRGIIPKQDKNIYKYIALVATGVQLFFAIILYMNFDSTLSVTESPFTVQFDWIPSFNIEYYIGVDGLSMPMIILAALLSFLCVIISWNVEKHVLGYFSLFLLLDAGMMGVFMSLDFFLFYVFREVMLLPMYFLIGMWGGPQRHYAAIKFFLYTLFG